MEKLNFAHWTITEYELYFSRLTALSDSKYREFHGKLVPGIGEFLGVRIPELRKLAKEITAGNWREFLCLPRGGLYEEKMVSGMVTALCNCPAYEKLELLRRFIPMIDNWAVCDVVAGDCKFIKKHKELMKEFLIPYLESQNEFEVRFAVVLLLGHYTNTKDVGYVLCTYDKIRHLGYYVKMSVAWGVSVCYAKFPLITMDYLKKCSLDDDTYNKALQKICESNRVTMEEKQIIKTMKKK